MFQRGRIPLRIRARGSRRVPVDYDVVAISSNARMKGVFHADMGMGQASSSLISPDRSDSFKRDHSRPHVGLEINESLRTVFTSEACTARRTAKDLLDSANNQRRRKISGLPCAASPRIQKKPNSNAKRQNASAKSSNALQLCSNTNQNRQNNFEIVRCRRKLIKCISNLVKRT